MSDVIVSVKPQFVELIRNGKKTHEFRKYIPKLGVSNLWIYATMPTGKMQYLASVDSVTEYPNQIPENGFGNSDFNAGLKKSNYAYHILHLFELTKPITLAELKANFGFFPPQSYSYLQSNKMLMEYLKTAKLQQLF